MKSIEDNLLSDCRRPNNWDIRVGDKGLFSALLETKAMERLKRWHFHLRRVYRKLLYLTTDPAYCSKSLPDRDLIVWFLYQIPGTVTQATVTSKANYSRPGPLPEVARTDS